MTDDLIVDMTDDLTATDGATVLLISADPSHPLAALALRYARAFYDQKGASNTSLKVFFYADAAHIANRLRWQSADQPNLTLQWQALAQQHNLALKVCVSTALSRGVSDADNSNRHGLSTDNLATGFELVGLGELAMMLQSKGRLLQF